MMQLSKHSLLFQHSVYAAIVFLIVAHPETFAFVKKTLHIKNNDTLLIVHSIVAGVAVYFGTIYFFNPFFRTIEGMKGGNGKQKKENDENK